MEEPFPFVAMDTTVDTLSSMMNKHAALLVRDENNTIHIITQADLLAEAIKN
jgi:cystathionine beta-synthase